MPITINREIITAKKAAFVERGAPAHFLETINQGILRGFERNRTETAMKLFTAIYGILDTYYAMRDPNARATREPDDPETAKLLNLLTPVAEVFASVDGPVVEFGPKYWDIFDRVLRFKYAVEDANRENKSRWPSLMHNLGFEGPR